MGEENLAGKLKDVVVGDILRLRTQSGDEAVGFVTKMQNLQIKLSLESPNNKCRGCYGGYESFYAFTKGDRWYSLDDFNECEVIRSQKQ